MFENTHYKLDKYMYLYIKILILNTKLNNVVNIKKKTTVVRLFVDRGMVDFKEKRPIHQKQRVRVKIN